MKKIALILFMIGIIVATALLSTAEIFQDDRIIIPGDATNVISEKNNIYMKEHFKQEQYNYTYHGWNDTGIKYGNGSAIYKFTLLNEVRYRNVSTGIVEVGINDFIFNDSDTDLKCYPETRWCAYKYDSDGNERPSQFQSGCGITTSGFLCQGYNLLKARNEILIKETAFKEAIK